jgi:hypothetical protein
MNQAIANLRSDLPLPAERLADKFSFCGALQLLALPTEASFDPSLISLFFPLPAAQGLIHGRLTAGSAPSSSKTGHGDSNTELPLFEPYHTIDYFASQGIKAPVLDDPKDRFGQQLKSFTDWLKVMKRVPLSEVTKQIPVEQEQQVAQLAHHSLDEKQVWTEAMAEVWAKQGERQKAIRIYEKLSLLEPAKSAYFAGKIDVLKKES